MKGFIEGTNLFQTTLFPDRLDDFVAEDNQVRVIDFFIDKLDISGLGFKTEPNDPGRPAYHPAMMLKLYVCGYLNRVQSSRRLEREAQRNIGMMWLTGRLAPDFKTIADFRKDDGEAIGLVCQEFVVLCKKLDLFPDAFVAINGNQFKAVNPCDRNFTKAKVKHRLQQIDESIERYLGQITSADREESAAVKDKAERLQSKISKLEEEMERLKKPEVRMLDTEQAVLQMAGITCIEDGPVDLADVNSDVCLQVMTEEQIKQAVPRTIDASYNSDEMVLILFYLSDTEVIRALKRARVCGVHIRVILDPNKDAFGLPKSGMPNRPVGQVLAKSGISVRWADTHGEQCHNKLLLVHSVECKSTPILGYANFTRRNLDDFNLETAVLVSAA